MTNNISKWEPAFSVDIEEIDTHQKKMFELFEELMQMKRDQSDAKDCINMITHINDYSRIYFSTEERLLKKKKYPDLAGHIKDHRKFTKRFIALRRELSEDIDKLTDEVVIELGEWLRDHILSVDAQYIPFLRITRYVEDIKK